MQGLTMELPLVISAVIRHAAAFHASTEIVARRIEGELFRHDHALAHARTRQLANALLRLGMKLCGVSGIGSGQSSSSFSASSSSSWHGRFGSVGAHP